MKPGLKSDSVVAQFGCRVKDGGHTLNLTAPSGAVAEPLAGHLSTAIAPEGVFFEIVHPEKSIPCEAIGLLTLEFVGKNLCKGRRANLQPKPRNKPFDPLHVAKRFSRYIESAEEGMCWKWDSHTNPGGYGIFGIKGTDYLAHRVAYQLHHGKIPTGLSVMHACDNPSCVNPSHLEVGTQEKNIRDCVARGRRTQTGIKGDKSSASKLTASAAASIRAKFDAGESRQLIAKSFGISLSLVFRVGARKAWAPISQIKTTK